jgi:hypothetical protein
VSSDAPGGRPDAAWSNQPGLTDFDAWDSWHPRVAAQRLAGVTVPWYVAAGWALDLFRGRQTRDHEDLEIAVPLEHFETVAGRFDNLDFFVVGEKTAHPVPTELMRTYHQTWGLSRTTGRWCLDIFREPHDGDVWICRRDERIRRPYAEIIEHDAEGIPYLAPEYVLLFKAKLDREKDRADLHGVLPRLDADRRGRLRDLLAQVHPDHGWLPLLAA